MGCGTVLSKGDIVAVIYYSVQGSFGGGGPSVHVARMTQELRKLKHKVVFSDPQKADVVMAIINTGKILKKVNRDKTRVILRIDGIYNKMYNEKFNRAIRPDMTALHDELKRDIPRVDWVCYQSQWSKDRIDDEIVARDNNYSIIHNGCDTNLFKPMPKKEDGVIRLIHCGRMRDGYLMEMLIKTYLGVKKNHNAQLLLIGGMDAGCAKVYSKYASDKNIIKLGAFPNTKLTNAYNMGDIFLDVRQGSSSNNVVAEAQSCGLPVVAPEFTGDVDMIVDKKSGIIVPSGKWDYDESYVKNLVNGVEKIIPDLNGFKLRARQHAVKELTIEKMVDKYLKAMEL